jgi:hypothetical protein
MKVSFFLLIKKFNFYLDTDNSISSPSRTVYQYETVALSPPIQYENSIQQPTYISFESNSPYITKEISTTPAFQKKLPIIPVAILGLFEILSGLTVLVLEILIFDIAIGLWCGFIYVLAGMAAIILGLLITIRKQKKIYLFVYSDWYRS